MPDQLKMIPERCIGCRSCELACSLVNDGEMNPSKSRIAVISFIEGKYLLPYMIPFTCKQCVDAPCMRACPVDAISRSKDRMKVITLDEEQCIGCGKCVSACPFGAMSFETGKKKAFKCQLCGGNPVCASICPTGAIVFGRHYPFHSKGVALEIEGYSILSLRNQKCLREKKSEKGP
jgi:carbon-monoxide dehydrogenase iron sulfur subunit